MNTLEHILNKFNLSPHDKLPLELPNYGRDNMAELFNELGFKIGVEVGIRSGEYSETLCKAIPGVKLYGIDPYIAHKGYRDHTRQSSFNTFKQEAIERLAPYKDYVFIEKFSMDAVKEFADNSLDFVYIDGDHSFQSATNDIAEWGRKVRPGGIISGDDYFKHKGKARIHVYQVVNAYTDAWSIRPWFVVGSQAIIPGEIRDHGRSWFWVKE